MWFFIILAVYAYLGWRLAAPLPPKGRLVVWAVIAFFTVCVPITMVAAREAGPSAWIDALMWAVYLFMGLMLLLLPLLVLRDLGWLAAAGTDALRHAAARNSAHEVASLLPDPERRRFLARATNLGALALAGGLTGIGLYGARRTPAVKQVAIRLPGLPADLEGFRIVQITDTHISYTMGRDQVRRVVDAVNALDADIVAHTGDLVDGRVSSLRRADVAPLADLRARHGTFFVTGNHEYYYDLEGWLRVVREMGFDVLLNEHRLVTRRSGRLLVCGVTDFSAGEHVAAHRSDLEAALRGAPRADVRVLLAHQPESFRAAQGRGVDLMLCGHTHGGQFAPWMLLMTATQPLLAGLYRRGDMQVYVSRGTGTYGPPLRLAAPSEITLLTLTGDET
jgi:predicted MPP superfamily phosphohydrolase